MRKTFFFCCCLLAAVPPLRAQIFYHNFFSVVPQSCPFNPDVQVTQPPGWIIYQTLDSRWDGPVDTSRCISAVMTDNNCLIDLEQIDPSRPLFVRALTLGNQMELPVNALLSCLFSWDIVNAAQGDLLTDVNCVEDVCSGVFIGIGVPPPHPLRVHTGLYGEEISGGFCFPTEYFPGQILKEVILKVTLSPQANLSGKYLQLYSVQIFPTGLEPGLVTSVDAQEWHYNNATEEYDVNIFETVQTGGWSGNYLLQYTEPTFPSAADPSYVEGTVTPASAQQETINLIVDDWENLEIQPFTHLRGALVEGSDSLRHVVNLVNNGGQFCLNFVDLIFSGGNQYRHGKGGAIDVHNPFSCFQFRKGSALRVMEDATLHYGTDGAGMLAFCATGTIQLEKNATLVVDGVMNIAECDESAEPTHIYMDLPKTASLIFTEKAHLTNRFSHGQQMELRVRMLGGTLDDSRLPAADRALIRRIYLEPVPKFSDNFSFNPNPFQSTSVLSYISPGTENLRATWFSADGKRLLETSLQAVQGINEWTLENVPETPGLYWLHLNNGRENTTIKVVRME